MFKSPLQRAIARGMKPGGDLADELQKLGDYPIRLRKDAKAICEALQSLPFGPTEGKGYTSPLHALTTLFQAVEGRDAPAFDVLYDEGQRQLMRIFDAKIAHVDDESADDLLMVLKILATYGSREGAEKIVEAARRPLKPDAYLWHVILSVFSDGHPQQDYVFAALSDPLPTEFLAVALLDSANGAAIKGELPRHPFNSPAGWARLQNWLEDRDPENFSYAHSATATLPFVDNPSRDTLLALAMDHVDTSVQMEAAWAAGKLGSEGGLKMLARYCLDTNHSNVAQQYLAELNREDLIPAEAKEPSFVAQAAFVNWLAHPNELGKPPDELQIVDHRFLAWPPEHEPKPFWLIRYCVRDRTGLEEDKIDCGLVGSMTWCFFSYKMHERPPEDAAILKQWQGAPLQEPRILRVTELSSKLKGSARLVAMASARLNDDEGWVVLDGRRSTWYPKADQPMDTYESVILKIHVGRQLLDFHEPPNREKYLITNRPRREPQHVIEAYEKLLDEVAHAGAKRQKELLGSGGLLSSHFEAYIEARTASNGTSKSDAVLELYGRFLQLAARADDSIRDDLHDSFSVLGRQFSTYVDALVEGGGSAEIDALIELFAPLWDHNLGYGQLGTAAFKAGRRDVAERYFLKLLDGLKDYCRSEEMSLLAEIWHDRGEAQRAGDLLIDCLRKLVTMIQTSKYNGDRQLYAGEFRHHWATYLRLFPQGANDLAKHGLPVDPLR